MNKEYKSQILVKINERLAEHLDNVPEQFTSTDNFLDGCVVVMNTREAQDIQLEQSNLVLEGYPKSEYCQQLIQLHIDQIAMENTGDETADEVAEGFIQELSDYVFYRFKDASQLKDMNAVLVAFDEISFWPPIYIMLNGVWCDTMQFLVGSEEN